MSEEVTEAVARAIYAEAPNGALVWRPNTAGGHSQELVPDSWEDAPDRHEVCLSQARAAIDELRRLNLLSDGERVKAE